MPNEAIRQKLDAAKRDVGILRYQVAFAMGINEASFSRWLRRELPEEKMKLVASKIEELVEERLRNATN